MIVAERRRQAGHILFVTLLFLVSAFYFRLGAFSSLEMTDEGLVVYPSWRVAQGALPYRDLQHIYPPGVFFLNGALFAAFGANLAVVRWSLVALKAGLGLLVLFLARRVASAPASYLAWFLFVAAWGAPIWVFNSPYANHYGLALSLLGLLLLTSRPDRRVHLAIAGCLLGLAALFKQTLGALYAIAALCALLSHWQENAAAPSPAGRVTAAAARLLPLAALLAGLAVELAYTARDWNSASTAALLAPSVLALVVLGARSLNPAAPPLGARRVGDLLCFGAAVLLPLAACAIFYALLGSLGTMVHDTLGDLPHSVEWFVPFPAPEMRVVANLGIVLGGLGLLHSLTSTPPKWRGAALWGGALSIAAMLHFHAPAEQWGWIGDVFKMLWWAPLLIVFAFLPQTLRHPPAGANPDQHFTRNAIWFFAAAALVQLYPGADLPHVGMIFPVLLPLLAVAADRYVSVASERQQRGGRLLRGAAVLAVAALAAAPFFQAQITAYANRTPTKTGLARATGLWVPGSQFNDTVDLVARLRSEESDIFVLTNQTLLYFFSGHRSLFDDDEQVLYLIGTGLIPAADARQLLPEETILKRLRRIRPLVVDSVDSAATRRFREVYPEVAQFLAQHYGAPESFGDYRVWHPEDAS